MQTQNSDKVSILIPNIATVQWDKGFEAGWNHCSWRHEEAIERYKLVHLAFCKYRADLITPAGLIAEISSVFNNMKSN